MKSKTYWKWFDKGYEGKNVNPLKVNDHRAFYAGASLRWQENVSDSEWERTLMHRR